MIFFPLLSFLGFCLAYSLTFRRAIEESPLYIVSGLILTLYLAAYFGILSAVTVALLYIGCFVFISTVTLFFLRRYPVNIISPAFSTWLSLFLVLSVVVSFRQFYAWDEFMHWGPLAKLIDINKGFVSMSDAVTHKSYPPGAALFYYFFYSACGYSEGVTYVAHLLLMMSPWLIAVKKYRWDQCRDSIFSVLGLVVIFCAVYRGVLSDFSRIYLDVPVASMFGAMLVIFYFSKKSPRDILLLTPVACAFVLLKPQLLPFVYLLGGLVVVSVFLRHKLSIAAVLSLALLVSTAYLVNDSWHSYLSSINVSLNWSLSSVAQNIQSQIDGARAVAFLQEVQHQVPVVVMLTVLFSVVGFFLEPEKKREWLCCGAVLVLGFLAYIFFLFMLCMFSTIEYNGLMVDKFIHFQSVGRYVAVYLLAVTFLLYRVSLECVSAPAMKFMSGSACVFSSALVIFYCASDVISFKQLYDRGATVLQQRPVLSKLAEKVKQHTLPADKVFTAWEASTAIQYYILLYELMPRRFERGPFKFGVPEPGKEAFYMNFSPIELKEFLTEFDAVFLAYTNEAFWKRYKDVFVDLKKPPLIQYQIYLPSKGGGNEVLMPRNAYLLRVQRERGGVSFLDYKQGVL